MQVCYSSLLYNQHFCFHITDIYYFDAYYKSLVPYKWSLRLYMVRLLKVIQFFLEFSLFFPCPCLLICDLTSLSFKEAYFFFHEFFPVFLSASVPIFFIGCCNYFFLVLFNVFRLFVLTHHQNLHWWQVLFRLFYWTHISLWHMPIFLSRVHFFFRIWVLLRSHQFSRSFVHMSKFLPCSF